MSLTMVRRRLRAVDGFLRPSRAEDRSIPVLDGGLSPNDALDAFTGFTGTDDLEPDDVVAVGDWVLVSSGARVQLLRPESATAVSTHEFELPVGAMASDGLATIYVCLVGGPLCRISVGPDGSMTVDAAAGPVLVCPTDAVLHLGRLFVSEGSETNGPDEWRRDLMTKGRTGRVVEVAVDGSGVPPRVVVGALGWAGGVAVDPADPSALLVTESWQHRVVRSPISGGGAAQVGRLLPGYPARLVPTPDGHLLVTFLSLRTHLVEFVLREDEYRAEMVRTVHPDFWISPTLRLDGERWEPLQIGSMKHLNVTKPWAPPRAYGLVAEMAPDGTFTRSWHARVGSPRSGVTGAAISGDRLVVACRGGRMVLTSDGEF